MLIPAPIERVRAQFFVIAVGVAITAPALHHSAAWAVAWTAPVIVLASVLITWGAEAAQFFVAQGFALAILAWMQTLPEFAVEAVLAWRQETSLLIANLTGALRLLVGLAWPMIYATAAAVHRKRTGQPLRHIQLIAHQSVEVVGLLFPLLYALLIWTKGAIHLYDAIVLAGLYGAYLVLLIKLPPEEHEGIADLFVIPRKIVLAPGRGRIGTIALFFIIGGILIYFTAEPFLGSLIAVAGAIGIPSFIVIQWLAPVISEFPELASTFYFARQEENASIAIMNIASSNINQWTLLVATLPVVFSISRGEASSFSLDEEQRRELLLTIGQSFVAMMFLANMRIEWWEALMMFSLFSAQFVMPAIFGAQAKIWITAAFFLWTAGSILALIARGRLPRAIDEFMHTWRIHIRS